MLFDPADKFIPLKDGFIGGVVPKLFLLRKYQSKHGREKKEGQSSAFHLFLSYKLFWQGLLAASKVLSMSIFTLFAAWQDPSPVQREKMQTSCGSCRS
jgi:hypothetical protein